MKTTLNCRHVRGVVIWGARSSPVAMRLNKSGFSAGEIGLMPVPPLRRSCRSILALARYRPFFQRKKSSAVPMFAVCRADVFRGAANHLRRILSKLLLAYSLTYMSTIALTNSIAFANVPDVERDFPRIRVMGTIGWIASGLRLWTFCRKC